MIAECKSCNSENSPMSLSIQYLYFQATLLSCFIYNHEVAVMQIHKWKVQAQWPKNTLKNRYSFSYQDSTYYILKLYTAEILNH